MQLLRSATLLHSFRTCFNQEGENPSWRRQARKDDCSTKPRLLTSTGRCIALNHKMNHTRSRVLYMQRLALIRCVSAATQSVYQRNSEFDQNNNMHGNYLDAERMVLFQQGKLNSLQKAHFKCKQTSKGTKDNSEIVAHQTPIKDN